MPSKELIEKVARSLAVVAWDRAFKADANFMMHVSPQKTPIAYENERWECYKDEAKAAISTTLAEIAEADIAMINAAEAYTYRGSKGYTGLWRAMLAASALGEQSE